MNQTPAEERQRFNVVASPRLRLFVKMLGLLSLLIAIACGGNGTPDAFASALVVTATPTPVSMRPGETKTVHLKFTPGELGGYAIRLNVPGLTVTPATFNIDLQASQLVERDVQVTAPANAPADTYTLSIGDQAAVYQTVPVVVSDGTPDFTITATPLEVTVPSNVNSEDVEFTVTSVNGFSGPVKITWVVDGAASPSPSDNDFTGTVTPTAPFIFTRKMYRYATHSVDIPMTFNATDVPFTKQHSVTINIKRQP